MIRRFTTAFLLCLLTATISLAEEAYFDSNGVKIRYVVEGKGEPVVLIHGFTANISTQWGSMLGRLAEKFQVVAIENRGHGKSDKPHDPKLYGPEMAKDVLRLMDHLKIPKAHLVGYSLGGFITNYIVVNHPERVITATLGGAGWRRPNDKSVIPIAESLEAGKGLGPLFDLLTPAGQPKTPPEQLQAINQMMLLTNDPQALAACVRGLENLGVTEAQLKANKVPILAIIGEIDPLRQGVDELALVMPHLQVDVLVGADHMTAFNQPKFFDDMVAFIESYSATKRQ